ncbi:hypothetical protein TI39_contig4336g00001 [Zymoseptoria brevis]|uniref:JmjC domain-containing protein n=1 Tax=Zymoseptoria brevis TaxID=1047168 RepID=A0A0F4G7L7_9PEZI|nr:hypothetical protein TI39_contig4336g00001 [Zymoseptoria brevis]
MAHFREPVMPCELEKASMLEDMGAIGQQDLCKALSDASLTPLKHCSTSVRMIWEGAGGVPVGFDSSRAYHGRQHHTDRALHHHLITTSRARIFRGGVENPNAQSSITREILLDLVYDYKTADPKETQTSAMFILKDDPYFSVPRLDQDPMPQEQDNTEVILTTKGGMTDLHIDNGQSVVSTPVEQSRRIFFFWPPTKGNLEILDEHGTRGGLLKNCCRLMEGGLFYIMGSDDAVRMRSGTIHGVVTIVGGFIATKAYIDQDTLESMTSWLVHSPSYLQGLDDRGLEETACTWLKAAEHSPINGLVKSWPKVEAVLGRTIRAKAGLRKQAKEIWLRTQSRMQDKEEIEGQMRGLGILP